MEIAIYSDLHGNPAVLKTLMDNVFPTVDHIWAVGDLFYSYNKDDASKAKSTEVMETLLAYKDKPVDYIMGNTDAFEEFKAFQEVFASETFLVKEIDGLKIILTHGHLYETELKMQELLNEHHAKIMVYGHSHLFEIKIRDNHIFLNPGSVTLPRDENTIATYLLLNTIEKRVQLKEINTGDILEELYIH